LGGTKGVSTDRKTADAFAANVLPIVRQIQAAGAATFRAIAAALNDRVYGAWWGLARFQPHAKLQ
jgi:hypothetical protein